MNNRIAFLTDEFFKSIKSNFLNNRTYRFFTSLDPYDIKDPEFKYLRDQLIAEIRSLASKKNDSKKSMVELQLKGLYKGSSKANILTTLDKLKEELKIYPDQKISREDFNTIIASTYSGYERSLEIRGANYRICFTLMYVFNVPAEFIAGLKKEDVEKIIDTKILFHVDKKANRWNYYTMNDVRLLNELIKDCDFYFSNRILLGSSIVRNFSENENFGRNLESTLNRQLKNISERTGIKQFRCRDFKISETYLFRKKI